MTNEQAAREALRNTAAPNNFRGCNDEFWFNAGWQAALSTIQPQPVSVSEDEAVEIMAREIRIEILRNRFPNEPSKYNDAARAAYRALIAANALPAGEPRAEKPSVAQELAVSRDALLLQKVGFTCERTGQRHTFDSMTDFIMTFLDVKRERDDFYALLKDAGV